MSFLTEAATRRLALTSRVVAVPVPRHFTTSIAARKTVTETAKDTLKAVDRKVSDKLVDGISAGGKYSLTLLLIIRYLQKYVANWTVGTENIASKVKGEVDTGKVKGTAEEIRGQAKGQAEELKGKAKGAAKEAEGKVKGSL